MIAEGTLKENVDGEALIWAYRRSLNAPAARRLLVTFSDGAPVDDSTFEENDADYLKRHLQAVAKAIEEHGLVSLVAVGLGHDPSPYYERSITLSGDFKSWLASIIASLRLP